MGNDQKDAAAKENVMATAVEEQSFVGEENFQGVREHTEGRVARAIEEHTAQLPSDVFLWAAGASIAGSLVLQLMGRKDDAQFVGQWAPTLLILGLYNKLVKVAGHDQYT